MADISAIKTQERMIEMHHPADETKLLGIRVSLVAMSAPDMKKIKRAINDEKLRLDARGKYFKADDIENNQNKLIFGAMRGWEWYNPTGVEGDKDFDANADATFHGKKPDFNQKNVYDVMEELEWFADQLAEAISDEKAFF